MPTIHPTAIIDPTARIADTAEIGPYCVIGPAVEIGDRTVLHHHVSITRLTTIGADNEIWPFAVLGADPQDRKYEGEVTTLEVGSRNKIREHVTIHRGTGAGGGVTVVGSDNLIMGGVHVAHDCHLGDHIVLANHVLVAGHVRIEDGATVSGGTGIHHFATVGAISFVGALARIGKDVPPYMTVEGNPAEVRSPNRIGMERRGFTEAEIEAVKECFRRLFVEKTRPMAEKIAELRAEYDSIAAVQKLCDALTARAEGVHGRHLELARTDVKRSLRLDPVGEAGRQPSTSGARRRD